jgi:N6-adenosine-specific RNA methylase IME4
MRYRTLVIDPPWQYNKTTTVLRGGGRGAGAEHHYGTMTNTAIAALPIGEMAEDDAHLYLWTTNPVLLRMNEKTRRPDPTEIVRAWGFEPKALLTWVKTTQSTGRPTRGGMGWYYRGATEQVIFAVRGRLMIPASDRLPNVFLAPRGPHSAKPDVFMEMVESVSPSPRVELFARTDRQGWDQWGDESTNPIDMPSAA